MFNTFLPVHEHGAFAVIDYYPPNAAQRWTSIGTDSHFLWRDCFSSFSQWRESRHIKVPQAESLHVCYLTNSSWAQEELQGKVQPTDGALLAEKKMSMDSALCCKTWEEDRSALRHSHVDDLVSSLKDCARQKDLLRGTRLHGEIVEQRLSADNVFIGSALIDMYAKCGELGKAQDVLDKLQVRNEVSWTALITGYAHYGLGDEALDCFEQMQQEGFSPNAITFVCALKACGSIKAATIGQDIHNQIAKANLLDRNVVVGNALVDMYVKCGLLGKAQEVFDKLPLKNVVSWTTLISGYTRHGHSDEALHCYEQMQSTGLSPNAVTFTCVLKALSDTRALDRGQQVHAKILKDGLLENDLIVGTALVDMYAKYGLLCKAQEVFDGLSVRNVVSWTVLIAGYVQHELSEEALNQFEQMQHDGIAPDGATFSCVLKACGSIGMAHKGQALHDIIMRDKLLEKDMVVGTALVDMYSNCGMLAEAQNIFNSLPVCDVILWNALLEGYAQIGKDNMVFTLFDQMLEESKEPDAITFTIILNTCSHSGLLDKGRSCFEILSNGYGVVPIFEHYTCVVDLFGRAGQLENAVAVVEGLPFSADFTLWQTLLCACQRCANKKLGTWAFGHGVRSNETDAAAYVSLKESFYFW